MNAADYIAGVGAVLTGIGLIYAGLQMRLARRVARAEFLLQLDAMFREHQRVEHDLRVTWADGGPGTHEEWIAVENYMGLFERVQAMVDDGIIDLNTFDMMYGYKLFYLVRNRVIHDHKLVERQAHWTLFIKLWRSLERLGRDRRPYSPVSPPVASSEPHRQ